MIQKTWGVFTPLLMLLMLFTSIPAYADGQNEGITCLTDDQWVRAEWGDRSDSNQSAWFQATRSAQQQPANSAFDTGCMGRCGAGCGSDRGAGFYTKDCMDHDVCGLNDEVLGGAFDRDCGDEFRQAADDFVFGFACRLGPQF